MDFQNLSADYEKLTKCLRDAEEFDKLCKENPEHVKQVFLDGMKTEFWRFFQGCMVRTKWSMEQNLKGKSVNNLDDCIILAKFNTIYKQTDELINFPNNFLKTLLKLQEKTNARIAD